MANVCQICSHPDRLAIDRKIVAGEGSLASVADFFSVPYYALSNHAAHHVSRQLAQAYDKIQLAQDFDLLGIIDKILKRCEDIFQRNYDAKHDTTALKALAESRATIDLLAKISYQLHQSKLAELELLKEKKGDNTEQARQEYEQAISILSIDELPVFQRMVNKITNQNTDVIIRGNRVLAKQM